MEKKYTYTLKDMNRELFQKARGKAITEGRTLTTVIVLLLKAWLAGEAQV